MLDGRLVKLIGVSMLGSALLFGCDTGDDDDATEATSPTPGVEATPEYLDFDTTDTYVECVEEAGESVWYYELTTTGWAEEYPYVIVYDNYDVDWYDYDPNNPNLWIEEITLDTLVEEGGDTVNAGYYQVWVRDDLDWVDGWELYTEDVNTIFTCDNALDLTYVFYASDYWDGYEICTAIGKWPEVFGPDCLY